MASLAKYDLTKRRGSVGLHAGEDVLVDLHGERHAGVAEPLADEAQSCTTGGRANGQAMGAGQARSLIYLHRSADGPL